MKLKKSSKKAAPAKKPAVAAQKKTIPTKKTVVGPNPLAGKVRNLEEKVGHYRRALGKALYQKRMTEMALKESQKKALLAISTAAQALAACAVALAEDAESEAAPAAEPAAKPVPAAKKKAAESKEEPKPAVEEKKPEAPKEKTVMDKVRDAVKDYAGINGRDAVRELLNKYTDKTVADIPADKLPSFLADLGG